MPQLHWIQRADEPTLLQPGITCVFTGRKVPSITCGAGDDEIGTYCNQLSPPPQTWAASSIFVPGLVLNGWYIRLLSLKGEGDKDFIIWTAPNLKIDTSPPRGKKLIDEAFDREIYYEDATNDDGYSIQGGVVYVKYFMSDDWVV